MHITPARSTASPAKGEAIAAEESTDANETASILDTSSNWMKRSPQFQDLVSMLRLWSTRISRLSLETLQARTLSDWLSTMTVIVLKTRDLPVETPVVALARVHGCSLDSSMEEGEFHIFTVLFKTCTIWSIACCTYVSMSTPLQKTDNVWRSCFWQGLTRDAMRYQRFPRLVRVLSIRGRSSQRRWCSGGRL